MDMPRLNTYDIIEVTWLDSHSKGGWNDEYDIKKWIDGANQSFLIETIGYFFHQDENFLRVAQCHDYQGYNEGGKDNLDNLYAIEKACIKEIKIIKREED